MIVAFLLLALATAAPAQDLFPSLFTESMPGRGPINAGFKNLGATGAVACGDETGFYQLIEATPKKVVLKVFVGQTQAAEDRGIDGTFFFERGDNDAPDLFRFVGTWKTRSQKLSFDKQPLLSKALVTYAPTAGTGAISWGRNYNHTWTYRAAQDGMTIDLFGRKACVLTQNR